MNVEKAQKYLAITQEVANLSKDRSTRVGALILGKSLEPLSFGYNGAPRGCDADMDDRSDRPEKYFWFSHAEANAITNAARTGTPLLGASIIITHPPCMECARAIVQSGISQVFCPPPSDEFAERWEEHINRSARLFAECGVEYTWLPRK